MFKGWRLSYFTVVKVALCRNVVKKTWFKKTQLWQDIKCKNILCGLCIICVDLFVTFSLIVFCIKTEPPEENSKWSWRFCHCSRWLIKVGRGTLVFVSWKINMDSSKASPDTAHSHPARHCKMAQWKNKQWQRSVSSVVISGCPIISNPNKNINNKGNIKSLFLPFLTRATQRPAVVALKLIMHTT